jgi:hypothetical protein
MAMSSKNFSIQKRNTDPCLAKKKTFKVLTMKRSPKTNNITKSQKRIQQQSNTAMSRTSKLRNEQIPEVRPMLQNCCRNASINALAVPHALREISQQSDGTRTHALSHSLSLSLCACASYRTRKRFVAANPD